MQKISLLCNEVVPEKNESIDPQGALILIVIPSTNFQVSSLKGVERRSGPNTRAAFIQQWCWWCRGCELLQPLWLLYHCVVSTEWYKSHTCHRRFKSYWESLLRQLLLQNRKQGGWVESNSWIFIIPPLLLLRLQKSMLEFLLVFQFGLFICIQYSAFLFVFGS